MAPQLPPDFSDFLKLLNSHNVEYLLIGGWAVGFHGYARATQDIDVWVRRSPENAARIAAAIGEFGFGQTQLSAEMFLAENKIVRMGVPPVRIEVLTTIDGVDFEQCHGNRAMADIDGFQVPIIGLEDLKTNKLASGRHKDLADLDHLP
ncbi:MAG: hypothetical protein O3A00_09645 [Planctomycetota bacterium]|nr:hypothetical protein [Planctomycetota bacterium]